MSDSQRTLARTRSFLEYYADFVGIPAADNARAALVELDAFLEHLQGDLYLWRIGENDAETAMCGIRDTLEPTVVKE